MTEAKVWVDEVEVVVEALAAVGLEEGIPGVLVVPRLERGAGLHGAEDVHQAGSGAALGEDLLDAVLLAEGTNPSDELDGEAVLLRQSLRVLTDDITQWLGEPGEVEDPDVASVQLSRKRLGVADVGERAHDEDAVEAREHAADAGGVTIGQHGNGSCRKLLDSTTPCHAIA